MGEVVHLFGRASAPAARVAQPSLGADVSAEAAPSERPPSDADRAQAALFAELLADHRTRIADALRSEGPSAEQTRLDRAALRRELREVSAHLETIDRRST
ncbi:MAG: hypothetical protein PGN29_11450 [Gordonia paraffinivorans]